MEQLIIFTYDEDNRKIYCALSEINEDTTDDIDKLMRLLHSYNISDKLSRKITVLNNFVDELTLDADYKVMELCLTAKQIKSTYDYLANLMKVGKYDA